MPAQGQAVEASERAAVEAAAAAEREAAKRAAIEAAAAAEREAARRAAIEAAAAEREAAEREAAALQATTEAATGWSGWPAIISWPGLRVVSEPASLDLTIRIDPTQDRSPGSVIWMAPIVPRIEVTAVTRITMEGPAIHPPESGRLEFLAGVESLSRRTGAALAADLRAQVDELLSTLAGAR